MHVQKNKQSKNTDQCFYEIYSYSSYIHFLLLSLSLSLSLPHIVITKTFSIILKIIIDETLS